MKIYRVSTQLKNGKQPLIQQFTSKAEAYEYERLALANPAVFNVTVSPNAYIVAKNAEEAIETLKTYI